VGGRKRKQIAFLIASNFVIHPQILIVSVFKNSESFPMLIADKIFHVTVLFTAALRSGHYIFALWFLLSSSSILFISSPNLSRRRLDVSHTSTHGVAIVRI